MNKPPTVKLQDFEHSRTPRDDNTLLLCRNNAQERAVFTIANYWRIVIFVDWCVGNLTADKSTP